MMKKKSDNHDELEGSGEGRGGGFDVDKNN